jgi:steroid delta-isomerase-like uncharacterized protein
MDHEGLMQQLYDRINAGDLDGFGSLLADDFVEHEELPGFAPTRDGVVAFFQALRGAFPDLAMRSQEMLVSGDRVVTRARATGTQRGEWMGVAATGRPVEVSLIDIVRFDDGLAREHWGLFDAMKMMQQLGAVPGPPG